ncbi:MAG TPA: hypothetical protein P5572_21900, partial [Phycisphaerae bacterium]|nr:hypothetical protein [Phycisphaerae bacterium]
MAAETPPPTPTASPSGSAADAPPTPAEPGNAGAGAPYSRRRRWLFRIAFLLSPVILLGGGELAARLSGHGGYPPVIRHVGNDGQRDWYTTYRPGVDTFFYSKRSITGGMHTVNFTEPKAPDTVRILFLGGSAMQGYPYERASTNGAILEAMLNDAWAGKRRAEVLNLGATAMASFPARTFLDEMLPHHLDLVVIMTGNNEFYGAYGVSSLHTAGTTPAGMRVARWVRRLGLVQWMVDTFVHEPTDKAIRSQPLMERVAANQHVGPEDPLRDRARDVLTADLTYMVERCRQHNVPVMVCTLPVNERDLAPIGVDDPPSDPAAAAAVADAMTAGAAAADPVSAAVEYELAIKLSPLAARPHYLLGRAYAQSGDDVAALAEYTQARDLDTMPWRANSWCNTIARTMSTRGAIVCEMEDFMRAHSPHGAVGWELMCDHVHLTARGQALFAECIAREMTKLAEPLHVDAEALAALPSWEHYVDAGGTEIYEDFVAESRMRTLFKIPFMQHNNPEALARCQAR